MTDLNRGLSEVPGLIAERKRYEAWLAALDQRRESTPGHVFERVQADYKTRLQRVAEQLASHRQAIEEERKNVVSRLSLLEAEEQMRRDERAELELRSHVGELEGDDAQSAFGAVDEAIAGLVNEKAGLQKRISELESLLEPATTAGRSSGPASVTAEPVESSAEKPPASPDPADQPPQAHAAQAAAEDHGGAGDSETEFTIPPTAEHQIFVAGTQEMAPAPRTSSSGTSSGTTPSGSQPAQPSAEPSFRASDGLRTPSGTFDELKFLDTVIGKEPAKPRGPRASEISPLMGVEGAAREALGVPPLAANVPGNTPIVLRPSVALDQSKTLKCNECGAQNYPTEWYCERCGAELAAL